MERSGYGSRVSPRLFGGHAWHSGELLSHYRAWEILDCGEEIFDCMSSGVPHRHAVNRVIARKPPSHEEN